MERSTSFILWAQTALIAILLSTGFDRPVLSQGLFGQGNSEYDELLTKGRELETKKKYDSAIIFLNKAILLNPKGDQALYWRSLCYFYKRNNQKAISDISDAISLSPKDPTHYLQRAIYYNTIRNSDKALDDCNTALSFAGKKWIKSYVIYAVRGTALMRKGRYGEALNDFNLHFTTHKADNSAWEHLNRGYCFYQLNIFPDAIRDFEIVLNMDPDNSDAIFYQGICFLKSGELEKARTNALMIEEQSPARKIYFSGEHLLELYDFEKRNLISRQALSEAIEYKNRQEFSQAFEKIEFALLYCSSHDKAAGSLRDSIWQNLVEVYTKMKTKPEMHEMARKFVVQAAEKTEAKKYDAAISLLEKAVGISPYYPPAHFNLALLYAQVGRYQDAMWSMKYYLQLAPDAPDKRAAQDKIYEWEGKTE